MGDASYTAHVSNKKSAITSKSKLKKSPIIISEKIAHLIIAEIIFFCYTEQEICIRMCRKFTTGNLMRQ